MHEMKDSAYRGYANPLLFKESMGFPRYGGCHSNGHKGGFHHESVCKAYSHLISRSSSLNLWDASGFLRLCCGSGEQVEKGANQATEAREAYPAKSRQRLQD